MRALNWTFICTAMASALVTTSAMAQSCPSCASAPTVSVGDTPFSNTATGCNLSVGCGSGTAYNANFFSFTPATSGFYRLSLCNQASFDTVLAVLAGCDPAAGVLACNDDGAGCAGFSSLIGSVELTGGVTYKIAIGGYGATTATGSGTLTVQQLGAPGGGCSSGGRSSGGDPR